MRDGAMVSELAGDEIDESTIMQALAGVTK
jgi:hypothetical protein